MSRATWPLRQPSQAAVIQWLEQAENSDMAAATRNEYLTTRIAFCNWAKKTHRMMVNPIAGMERADRSSDRRHVRRALTVEEVGRLLEATKNGRLRKRADISCVRTWPSAGRQRPELSCSAIRRRSAYSMATCRPQKSAIRTPEAESWTSTRCGTPVGTHMSVVGLHPGTAMAAMRHSHIELTMNYYTDPVPLDIAGCGGIAAGLHRYRQEQAIRPS